MKSRFRNQVGKNSLEEYLQKILPIFFFLFGLSLLIVKMLKAKELDNFTKIIIGIVFY